MFSCNCQQQNVNVGFYIQTSAYLTKNVNVVIM